MKATDRHKARVQELCNSPMDGEQVEGEEFDGEASQDVATYTPMAAGVLSEVVSKALKSSEDKKAAAAAQNTDAAKAQKAAADATKNAAMAQADAITEADVNGPKHQAAAKLALDAQSAQAKANFYASQAVVVPGTPQGAMAAGGMPGAGHGGKSSTPTWMYVAGGVGAVGLLGVIVLLMRRK